MVNDGLKAAEHIVGVLDGTLADVVCIISRSVYNSLRLDIRLGNNLLCMAVGPLHNLMLIDHLCGLLIGLRHHGIGLFSRLIHHGIGLLRCLGDHGV